MKEKIIKRIIAIVIVMVIILIIGILLFRRHFYNNGYFFEGDYSGSTSPEEIEIRNRVEETKVPNQYFIVKNAIEKFYSYSKQLNTTQKDIMNIQKLPIEEQEKTINEKREFAQNMIYNILSPSYVEEFNIGQQDILEKFGTNNEVQTIIKKMYTVQNSNNVLTYFVSGMYVDTIESNKEYFYMAVSLDMLNNTFCIYPQEYCEKHEYDKIQLGDTLDIPIESIENKNYNTFEYKVSIDDSEIAKEYFENYKYTILYDTEYAYDILDKEYKEKRFSGIDNFKEYIEDNREAIEKAVLSEYSVDYEESSTKYALHDTYNNYFIIKANSIMNFTIKLDSYTVPESDFNTEYSKLKDAEKASANIGIFMQMINTKDYVHAYEKLSDGFKANYFGTLEEFKNYVKSNFCYINDYAIDNYKNEGDIYIYYITLTDHTAVRDKTTIDKTFNIRLGEGTDFEISFSVN